MDMRISSMSAHSMGPTAGSVGHMPPPQDEPERLVTVEEFFAGSPDQFGEIHDGVLITAQAQSSVHHNVIRRLEYALEMAIDPDGPCREMHGDTPMRLTDADTADVKRRARFRYPDLLLRDCSNGPYDAQTVASETLLVVEVTSEDTVDTDIGLKRELYAREGIPMYLVVRFDKNWELITEIEEHRIDWSGRRYTSWKTHRDALVLTEPVRLAVIFDDLQSRLPRRR
ncbi:Uma2 family endonuclease [Nocardia sp. NPDC127579]|uniref:Uma2 family endonuclease n=1 Tax=Nocardia sp. NPDC127579 TaxID=3345402 RepID=UPI00363F328F